MRGKYTQKDEEQIPWHIQPRREIRGAETMKSAGSNSFSNIIAIIAFSYISNCFRFGFFLFPPLLLYVISNRSDQTALAVVAAKESSADLNG